MHNFPKNFKSGKHLDFGAGREVRNPFDSEDLYSADIKSYPANTFSKHTLLEAGAPLPFADNFFDSISAYDVLEHLERSGSHGNVFIQVMNELHRILKPGGLALFIFPSLPNLEIYSDPTHVNILHKHSVHFFLNNSESSNYEGITTNYKVLINRKLRLFAFWVDNPVVFKEVVVPDYRRRLSLLKRSVLRFSRPTHRIWLLQKIAD